MSDAKCCPKCGAYFGQWYVMDRAAPHDIDRSIDLGKRDPGPGWWETVCKFWNVSDRPTKGCWTEPKRADATRGGCTLCAPPTVGKVTGPTLFDDVT